jgi:hypothetical protein
MFCAKDKEQGSRFGSEKKKSAALNLKVFIM